MDNPAQSEWIFDAEQNDFAQTVIQRSVETPVVVDFWATWCGPCKELTPRLEKCIAALQGQFWLAKVDIDKNAILARQLGIQSVPTVLIFYRGQAVTGFSGAQSEAALQKLFASLIEQLGLSPPPEPTDPYLQRLEQAQNAALAGQNDKAERLATEMFKSDPERFEAPQLLLSIALQHGRIDDCQTLLQQLPAKLKTHPEIVRLECRYQIAKTLVAALAANPAITQTELEKIAVHDNPELLANTARYRFSIGQEPEAVQALLKALADLPQPQRREHLCRVALVDILNALGFEDPLAIDTRKSLSSLLF